ncbi:MAG: molybdopterin synthase sulfur carrier subunit [Gammaproteobacteria bacterium]|jgi:molybdopterin synthase sulfur carrier subunit
MVKVKYFARLGENVKTREEDIEFDGDDKTVAHLIDLLRDRGEPWQSEFSGQNKVLVALNHEICDPAAALKSGDEVGFFPPVTGG